MMAEQKKVITRYGRAVYNNCYTVKRMEDEAFPGNGYLLEKAQEKHIDKIIAIFKRAVVRAHITDQRRFKAMLMEELKPDVKSVHEEGEVWKELYPDVPYKGKGGDGS